MANLKAIINKNVGNTLTTAYTNTSGADAALKAFNVNSVGNARAITTFTPTNSVSGFLGNSNALLGQSSTGTCLPNVIKLSENKLLLLSDMYFLYSTSTSRTEAQIVEWDGSKYINYPTTELNINLGGGSTLANLRGLILYGVALTSSKVAFISQGVIYVLTITNNTVDSTFQTLSVTSTFNSASTRMQPVPGSTDKVVVYGRNAAGTAYIAQAYNVPTGSAPTAAGSSFTAITSTTSDGFDFCLHRRTDPTYFFAAPTSLTVVQGAIATFDSATNTWTSTASPTNITTSNFSSSSNPILTVPLSTDGSSSYYTAVIIGSTLNRLYLYPQTSGTSVSSTSTASQTTTSTFTNGSRELYSYNLGSRKAIIGGANEFWGISDAGTFTSLAGAGAASTTGMTLLSLPFSSRPLYYYATDAAGYATVMARTGLTDTGFGTYTETGNFIQFGTPTGKSYAWSDTANCWFAVQGDTLYALDINGNILAERKITSTPATTRKYTAKVISIAPDGRICILSDGYGGSFDTDQIVTGNLTSNTLYCLVSVISVGSLGVTSPTQITSTATVANTTLSGSASSQPRKAGDLITYVNAAGNTSYICCGISFSTTNQLAFWSATLATPNASLANTNQNTATSFAPWSYYQNMNLMLRSLGSSGNDPTVMYIGSLFNSSASRTGYLNYTTTPVPTSSLANILTLTSLSTVTDDKYAPAVSRTQTGMSAILAPSASTDSLYLWTTFNNAAVASAYTISSMTNSLKPKVMSSQNITAICNGASGSTAITPFFQVWINTSTSPYASGTGTSTSRTIFNLSKSPDKYSVSITGNGVTSGYAYYGAVSTPFNLTINDGTNDFYAVNAATIAYGSQYRSDDVYYVPNGYSVKIQAGFPNQIDAMLEVLEQ
jgi:hypothetical protein